MRAPAPSAEDPRSAFDEAMARFGPFEPAPVLAVAVSGGRDSMALAVLAHGWARRRRGRAVALVVDHGLRPEAHREAAAVRRRLEALGIPCHILRWTGPKPATGLQAAARDARYRLLEGWCARHAVLHLLMAHQADDQAETVLMRRRRGSGPDGLAGIAAVVEREHVRLLRPLLRVPRAALGPFLARRGIAWVDDPSNDNPEFARSLVRAELASAARPDTRRRALTGAARRGAVRRAARERRAARLLARHAAILPAGYALVARAALATCAMDIAERALVGLLGSVGGGAYPPRGARLRALLGAIRANAPFRGRTLAGCRILPLGSALLFTREVPATRRHGRPAKDARFHPLRRRGATASGARWLAPLGECGWRMLLRDFPQARDSALPPAVRPALPAWWTRRGLLAVPHLAYGRGPRQAGSLADTQATFRPLRPLCPAEFSVA